MSRHWPRVAAALVALGCGSQADAADAPAQLEEVIVTATLRATPLQRLPASATVLSERTLADSANQHLEAVLPQVPSLSWAGASSRPRYFLLRGIGELEQYQGAPNPSVGFLVDEIDYSGVGMVATLFDVEQVEVLRGPQGTRNGANALAGLIKLKTRAPEPVPELIASAGVAGDGQWDAGVIAGGALPGSEAAAWRIAIQRQRSDGFRDNAFVGRDDTNGRTETTLRVRARLEPVPGWDADLTVAYVDLDNGYDAFAIDNTYRTLSDRPGRDAQRSAGAALDQAWDLTPALRLRSITSYADSRAVTSFDGDWGNARDWGAAGPYDFFSQTLRERSTLAQDLRLESAAAGTLDWVTGLYAQRLDEDHAQDDDGLYLADAFTRSLDSSYRATSLAAYADATRRLDGDWALAGGLRLEQRDARYADTDGFRFDPRDRLWGGQLSLERAAGGGYAYVTAARGYKAGGFNIGAAIPEDRLQFGPEHLWNFEAGYKRHAAAVAFDMAVFWQRRGDQQVATSYQLDPEDPLTFVYFTDNAARGTAYGLEGSLQWRAAPPWQVDAALSLMRSRYDGYRYGDRDLTGRAWAHAPDYKYSVAATWRHPLGWMARVDLAGEGAFYYDTSHDERAPDKMLVGLRVGYEAARWSAHAWVRNLFDERYATRGFYFGNEPPDFPPKLYLRLGDPRQAGLAAEWRFR